MTSITYIDNNAARDDFITIEVKTTEILLSWRDSVLSLDWLSRDGAPKPIEALKPADQQKFSAAESLIKNGEPIAKPVLGIGIQDNIEIGAGRAEFIALAMLGCDHIPVHIPPSNIDDFQVFRVDID